ncbi:MAG: hypothetical protein K2K97_08540, partial [Muribaculaceae bacterium]|nr:hypothetical protein [Muribaculaceae bacterium]
MVHAAIYHKASLLLLNKHKNTIIRKFNKNTQIKETIFMKTENKETKIDMDHKKPGIPLPLTKKGLSLHYN